LDDYKARLQVAKEMRALQVFLGRATHEQPDVTAAIEDERPDALLIDCMAWGAAAADAIEESARESGSTAV
jgi:hypothetical protein